MRLFLNILLVMLFYLASASSFGQEKDRRVNTIERLYNQGYYAKVLRKTNKMLNKKYSGNAYVHMFQVAALNKLKVDKKFVATHTHIEEQLKAAFNGWNKSKGYLKTIQEYQEIASNLNSFIENNKLLVADSQEKEKIDANSKKPIPQKSIVAKEENPKIDKLWIDTCSLPIEEKIIHCAETFMGVPYKYGGRNADGFDCSGYTGYILEHFGYKLPRSARDQAKFVQSIPIKEAKKGDLIFFSHKKNIIAHVGLVVSEEGEDLTMIHASSSRGIMISNVEKSTYWKPRLKSAGRVIEQAEQ